MGCSSSTIFTYKHRISLFLRYVAQDRPGFQIKDIGPNDIGNFLLDMRNKGRSMHYVRGIFIQLRVFFAWCVQEMLIDQSPVRNMQPPKVPKRIKPFMTEEQRDRLLALCPPNTFLGARNAAIIWLFWTTGIRLSELAGLQLADLDWENNRIKVFGKGSKERFVPFLKEAKHAIWRYKSHRKDNDPHLWLGEERRPLTKDGVDSATQRLVIRAGLQGEIKDLHHIFRRTWAMRQIRAGVPMKYIQLVGGWESVVTLERYVRAMAVDDALGAGWV